MDIDEIKQYAHKIVEIDIRNYNTTSSEEAVTIKIHLEKQPNEIIRFSSTKNPSNNEWIEHQSFENDYFVRIHNNIYKGEPKNKNYTDTYIYAHFLPASLYDYVEPQNIYSIYDFSDFIKDRRTNQWNGMEYPLQITSYGYEMLLGNDNKPLIRSLLKNSVTRYKDPNYKNYITTDAVKDVSDMTEKGRFPLSSRYRQSLYRTAPNLEDKTNFQLPYWHADEVKYSNGATPESVTGYQDPTNTTFSEIGQGYKYENENEANNVYDGNTCNGRNAKIPFWEAKIHRSGLSPLINDTPEDAENYDPINVYINYQYLPTSTEYHQHYFGFEGKNVQDKNGQSTEAMLTAVQNYNPDGTYNVEQTKYYTDILKDYSKKIKDGTYKQITTNRTYEVLDGEGLNDINQEFGNTDVTYRLIRHGNPFDSSNSVYVDHKNIYDVSLADKNIIKKNCIWDENSCENYFTYIPTGKGFASINVNLKPHTYYVLKYFIYIPADAYIEDDSCYMEVQSRVNDETQIIGQLHTAFKNQDKKLRHQWIYHEIPFYTYEIDNKIIIKGPQHNHEGIIGINRKTRTVITNLTDNDRNNPDIELHDCAHDTIHFYSVQIAEMIEYSPTIKYTKTGLYVVEGDKHVKKNLKEAINTTTNNSCISDETATNEWANQTSLNPADTWINKGTTQLPIPLTDIYVFFDDDFTIMYNKLTTELSYTKKDKVTNTTEEENDDDYFTFDDFNKIFDTELKWESLDTIISLAYDRITAPESLAKTNQLRTNRTGDDTNINELLLGELSLFNKEQKFFTTGINNSIKLQIQDAYGGAITTGQVECSIWTTNQEEDTPCEYAERCLGIQTPDNNGIIEYKHLNFRDFNPTRETYYLRVKYINSCYNKEITKWKTLTFIEERRNIEVYVNKCNEKSIDNTFIVAKAITDITLNDGQLVATSVTNQQVQDKITLIKNISIVDNNLVLQTIEASKPSHLKNILTDIEITNDGNIKLIYGTYTGNVCFNSSNCCQLTASSIFSDNTNIYEKASYPYEIITVDEYPLRLDVKIRSQPLNGNGDVNIIDEGYCELSVNDKVIQTTFVDSNGIADFYLDESDLDPGVQTVKIEYFIRPNEAVNYVYFIINCNTNKGYDERPSIPITINKITQESVTQLTDGIYEVEKDGIFFADIDSNGYTDFSITVIRNGETETLRNINEISSRHTIANMYKNNDKDKYTIITGNEKDANGNDINHKYRTTKKDFIVQWIEPRPKKLIIPVGIIDVHLNEEGNLIVNKVTNYEVTENSIELVKDMYMIDDDIYVKTIMASKISDLNNILTNITINNDGNIGIQ